MTALLKRQSHLWRRCDGRRFPALPWRYDRREQAAQESRAMQFLDQLENRLDGPDGEAELAAWLPRALRAAVVPALGLGDPYTRLFGESGLARIATDLAAEARRLDPCVSHGDVFQASRNAWVAAGLQALLGLPMQLTPAIFAYSMLYPYTDNLLDDPATPRAAKEAFNARFRLRLGGPDIEAASEWERKIWALVGRIEDQYPRAHFPDLYASLLAIHEAQSASLALRREARLPWRSLRHGVFFKGGASVLADAYLAAGHLKPEQSHFAFGWGVLLQLGDDLQDVGEDLAGGVATLFSETAGRQPLDRLTNRVFQFGARVLAGLRIFRAAGAAPLKVLMRRSAANLLVSAAGASPKLFSRAYIARLERHSPFRFGFVREQKERLLRRRAWLALPA